MTQRVVTHAKVYVAYRAYRTDLQAKLSIDPARQSPDIETKVARSMRAIRSPLCSSRHRRTQAKRPSTGSVWSRTTWWGYTAARDLLSSDKAIYAVVVGTPLLSIIAMFNADNVTLADPNLALAWACLPEVRWSSSSVPLVTVEGRGGRDSLWHHRGSRRCDPCRQPHGDLRQRDADDRRVCGLGTCWC